jgi:formamidopyrimidine-DNA glycosylase
MPELPEVDMFRRDLSGLFTRATVKSILGLRKDIWVGEPRIPSGQWTGKALFRHGKILVYEFSAVDASPSARTMSSWYLLSRFGMSGSWRRMPSTIPNPDHTHLEICFSSTTDRLLWVDPRRFGRLEWTSDLSRSRLLREVGPDALSVTPDELSQALSHASRSVRSTLMDQSVVAGIGNIYAAEILFRARINPFQQSSRLSGRESGRIFLSMKTVLEESLEAGGSTIHSYARGDGSPGEFQHQHLVYGREGQPCVACGIPVQKIVEEARSLYYCSFCQGSPESTSRRKAFAENLMN